MESRNGAARPRLLLAGCLTTALLAWPLGARAAQRFQIDPEASSVEFSVKNFGRLAQGRFTSFSGTILYDAADISRSSVAVTIQAESIDTGIRKRDRHLRSRDFFEVDAYPELSFRSRSVRKEGDGYVLVGVLTIKERSRPVKLPFTFDVEKTSDDRTVLRAQTNGVVYRHDFGLDFGDFLSIGNEVRIRIRLQADLQTAKPAPGD